MGDALRRATHDQVEDIIHRDTDIDTRYLMFWQRDQADEKKWSARGDGDGLPRVSRRHYQISTMVMIMMMMKHGRPAFGLGCIALQGLGR